MRFSLFSPTPHRACDFHRTRRSLGDLSPTWGHCSGTHYKYHHNFDLYFSAPIQLLIVLRQFTSIDVRYFSPFQQSYPSHIPLGACYGTDDLFGSLSYASPYLAASSTCIAAWTVSLYFAGSSDWNGHAHHGYGPPAYQLASWVNLLPTLPSFTRFDFRHISHVGVYGRYPYLSDCQFSRNFLRCVIFSITNESHPASSQYRNPVLHWGR